MRGPPGRLQRDHQPIGRLIDNLLDMSRLQAGALTLQLRAALEEVLPGALDSLPPDGPEVVIRNLEETPAVLADPPLLERVIANLVGNAARYAPAGRPILLSASALAGRVELHVVDRGPGLPPTDRERIFEPFQRLGDTDNTTGTGLGLALARGLTQAMDGTGRRSLCRWKRRTISAGRTSFAPGPRPVPASGACEPEALAACVARGRPEGPGRCGAAEAAQALRCAVGRAGAGVGRVRPCLAGRTSPGR